MSIHGGDRPDYRMGLRPTKHKYFTGDATSAQDVTDSVPANCHVVITDIIVSENGNTGGLVALKEETSGTVLVQMYVGGRETKIINLSQPIKLATVGKKLQVLSGASDDIKVTVTYYLEVGSMESFTSNY